MTTPLPTPNSASFTPSSSSSVSGNPTSSSQPLPTKPTETSSNEMTESKALFDEIALSVVSYLQLFDEVSGITVEPKNNRANHEITAWEKLNYPYKIPEDMKAFYRIFNGKDIVIYVVALE